MVSDGEVVVARAAVGRMERLGLRGYGGDWQGLHRTLALTDADSIKALRGPGLVEAFAALGWDFSVSPRGATLTRKVETDPAGEWYTAHVHPAPGSVASLDDVRGSFADFCQSRRYKVKATEKSGITKMLDEAGFRRTRWKDSDGNNITGYKDVAVTYDQGRPKYSIDLTVAVDLDREPTTAEMITAVNALAGLVDGRDLEMAYATFTDTPTRLCGVCGRLSIRRAHKECK